MKKLFLAVALAAGLFAPSAFAQTATFCTVTANAGYSPFTDQAKFSCGNGIKGTVNELLAQGWRVVGMQAIAFKDEVRGVLLLEKQ